MDPLWPRKSKSNEATVSEETLIEKLIDAHYPTQYIAVASVGLTARLSPVAVASQGALPHETASLCLGLAKDPFEGTIGVVRYI